MAKFLVLMRQSGEGCDYTIGCGIKWKFLEAGTVEEAALSAVAWVREYGWRDRSHHNVTEATLIPYEDAVNLAPLLDADVAREAREAAAAKLAEDEAAERAKLKELQAKYGNG